MRPGTKSNQLNSSDPWATRCLLHTSFQLSVEDTFSFASFKNVFGVIYYYYFWVYWVFIVVHRLLIEVTSLVGVHRLWARGLQFSSVTQSCPTLCDPMDCGTPGCPVHHQLLELTQTHAH